ncbi:putative quinol monooxygenase [Streptomyces sp. NPDC059255]|uniref:putative quinol monooxygenase n=1 Tax=Streptomyces sp. NPDC059255 TaxID=3346793 RepID=UPI0036742983
MTSSEPDRQAVPVIVTATFRPRPGARAEVIGALRTAAERVHAEPGCELYALHEAPDRLTLIEKWTTVGHLDDHGRAPAVQALHEALDGNLLEPADVVRLSPLPAGDPGAGAL